MVSRHGKCYLKPGQGAVSVLGRLGLARVSGIASCFTNWSGALHTEVIEAIAIRARHGGNQLESRGLTQWLAVRLGEDHDSKSGGVGSPVGR